MTDLLFVLFPLNLKRARLRSSVPTTIDRLDNVRPVYAPYSIRFIRTLITITLFSGTRHLKTKILIRTCSYDLNNLLVINNAMHKSFRFKNAEYVFIHVYINYVRTQYNVSP